MTPIEKLEAEARKALKAGSPAQALKQFTKVVLAVPSMRDALCLDFLERFHASQLDIDPHRWNAGAGQEGVTASESLTSTRQTSSLPPEPKPVPVVAHKRRSPGAINARMTTAVAFFKTRKISGQAIGGIRIEQAGKIVSDNAANAASYLQLGVQATEDAILMDEIVKWGVPADPRMTIEEFIPAEEIIRLAQKAKAMAPKLIAKGMSLYADVIQNREEIEDAAA